MSNYQKLQALPLFRPELKIFGKRRRTLYGFGRPEVRFGDDCHNGYNTFAITVDGGEAFGGCCHDIVREVWPEYAHLAKWHLVSTNGPLHYIANTTYHAKNGALESARSTAIAPNATIEQLSDAQWLADRLPDLLEEFATAVLDTFSDMLP